MAQSVDNYAIRQPQNNTFTVAQCVGNGAIAKWHINLPERILRHGNQNQHRGQGRVRLKKTKSMNKIKPSLALVILSGLSISQQFHAVPTFAQSIETPSSITKKQAGNKAEDNALASSLIQTFFASLSATGSPTGTVGKPTIDDSEARRNVKTLLDHDVIIQRADGDFFDYKSYYPIDIDEFTISNINTTKPRPDLIVATYSVSTPGATSLTRGYINSGNVMPRLTTFRYHAESKRWLILSHASFNQPISQICNQPSTASRPNVQQENENLSNQKTANELIEKLYADVSFRGEAIAHEGGLITRQTQIMSGDGYSRTGASRARSIKVGSTQRRGLFVTGSGNDLVVRFEAKNSSQIGVIKFTNGWQPRLATFSKNGAGKWELASFATFNYPATPPADAKCTSLIKGRPNTVIN
jgi:hypothetical protein